MSENFTSPLTERKGMRIVFMGTPEFAVASLSALVEAGFNIVGVITAPDRPAGRGMKMSRKCREEICPGKRLTLASARKT
jgi:methionyl-tRNA formyltransferase